LDKLESIPGFRVDLDVDAYRRLVREVGACLIGQTQEIAPADKRLYALRDVTATVESIPLIASSIMSKKLAEGIDALVLDVKVGSGAFMKDLEHAETLARTMVGIGTAMGKDVVALLTDMDQPLGRAIGHALEVRETIDVLRGAGPRDVTVLTTELGAYMLWLGEAARDVEEGREKIQAAIDDGRGLEKLGQIVEAQGGDRRVLDDPELLPTAQQTIPVPSAQGGVVGSMDAEAIGVSALLLGAGRQRVDDTIDHAVGVELHVRRGDIVAPGQPLATLHVNDPSSVQEATDRITQAIRLTDAAPQEVPLIHRIIEKP
jgi:pyrimidine-nucleoside phosphorylase